MRMAEMYLTEGDRNKTEYHGCHPHGAQIYILHHVPTRLKPVFTIIRGLIDKNHPNIRR